MNGETYRYRNDCPEGEACTQRSPETGGGARQGSTKVRQKTEEGRGQNGSEPLSGLSWEGRVDLLSKLSTEQFE